MALAEAHNSAIPNGPASWLVDPRRMLPRDARTGLVGTLYGGLPIFIAGSVNTAAVSLVAAIRIPQPAFIAWAALEILLAIARTPILLAGRRAAADGREGPIDLHLLLTLGRAANVGFGLLICLTSGDWAVACLACLSGGTMAGGSCFRNFAAPRLAAAIVLASLGPCIVGALLSGEPVLAIAALQLPVYMAALVVAAYRLNGLTVRSILAERENDRRVRHDPLTGALNRVGLGRDVAARIGAGAPFTLFYLDLDGFKGINDSFGHQIGDALLKAVAGRLKRACNPGDTVARIGGDEFVLICEGTSAHAANARGRDLGAAISEAGFFIENDAAFVGVSIGIAFFPDHGKELGILLAEADAALYRAKFDGRRRCVIARSWADASATPPRLRSDDGASGLFVERDAA